MNQKTRSRLGLAAAGLLLAANIVVPALWGDLYPFTSAPMFRDNPQQYCNYRVLAPDGSELPPEDWLVHRVYDGNPVGYGVGLAPPAVIEQQFGVVHEEHAVRRHITRQFARGVNRRYPYVEVRQDVVGPINSQHVGVVESSRWHVERPAGLPETSSNAD